MTCFKYFISIAFVILGLFITSCNKEDGFINIPEDQEIYEDNFNSYQKPEIFVGLNFMDSLEYSKLPVVELQNLESITGENTLETRNSRKVLNTPPVISQGREGSCTAFATAYCVSSYYMNVIGGMPYANNQAIRSPEFVYNSTKVAGACDKAGAYTNQVLNFIRDKGVCSWAQMPYSDTNGCTTKPNSTQLSQANIGKIASWSAVAKNVASVKDLINKGYPVVMAFDANDNFKSQSLKYPYIYKTFKADNKNSGHAVTIIGYDESNKYLIVQNSWGKYYHDNGIFYISYSLFPSIARELYFMNPVLPKNINIRNATDYGDITFKLNGISYLIKKGQKVSVPAKLVNNTFYVWECVYKVVNPNVNLFYKDWVCQWDGDYKPNHGKNYKVISDVRRIWDGKTEYDLRLVQE